MEGAGVTGKLLGRAARKLIEHGVDHAGLGALGGASALHMTAAFVTPKHPIILV
jgi:hypothetical protein